MNDILPLIDELYVLTRSEHSVPVQMNGGNAPQKTDLDRILEIIALLTPAIVSSNTVPKKLALATTDLSDAFLRSIEILSEAEQDTYWDFIVALQDGVEKMYGLEAGQA